MGQTRRRPWRLAEISFLLCALASPAAADEIEPMLLPDVTGPDYGLDIYLGPVLGSGRIVGMGGAAVALAQGSAGILANPAAPAVRPATSRGTWDWDFHIDWLSPQIGTDFDNNGISATEAVTPFVTVGVVGNYKQWALGLSLSTFQQQANDIEPEFDIAQLSLARSFLKDQLVAGLSVRTGTFSLTSTAGGTDEILFEKRGSSAELGVVWKPAALDIRVGGAASLPVIGDELSVDNCDPLDCHGFILPERIEVPWRLAAGVAWRRAPSRWNQTVKGDFRDEKSLILAADLVATGAVSQGHGLEAFAQKKLQRSGRSTVLSVRGGAEYEWVPGRFRIRGGTYWEPGRFDDENGDPLAGRMHLTVGLELRVYALRVWGDPYRIRLSLTSDGAQDYVNGGFSLGFWH